MEAAEIKVFVDEILPSRFAGLEPRDRRLLHEIVYGVSRHLNTLDALVNFHLKLPVTAQKPVVSWTLRVGAYQLVYLTRIPHHAALNQTVEAMKSLADVDAKAPGFVNAVLRKLARDIRRKSEEPLLDQDDPTVIPIRDGYCHLDRPVLELIRLDRGQHFAIKYSQQAWLVRRWLDRLGEEETRRLCEAQNRTPCVTARVTALAPDRDAAIAALRADGLESSPGSLDDSILLAEVSGLEACATLAKGWIQIQDETAIRIGAVLNPPAGAKVLDLCAAPGGKARQLLDALGPEGRLTVADRTEDRLALVRANLTLTGKPFTTALVPENPDQLNLAERFTHILVDAPCSNTGVLARRPEARWRVKQDDLRKLSELQLKLVNAALRHLEPGGRLVYATCSIEPEENENVIARACASHPGLVERDTRLFLPHRSGGDGGFYSLILKSRE